MSKKDKKSSKSKERGLNVRVKEEKKTDAKEDVRVNSYFEKNDTRRKNKKNSAANKAVKKVSEAAKKTAKRNTSEKKAKDDKKAKDTKTEANISTNGETRENTEAKKTEDIKPQFKDETKKPASFSKTKGIDEKIFATPTKDKEARGHIETSSIKENTPRDNEEVSSAKETTYETHEKVNLAKEKTLVEPETPINFSRAERNFIPEEESKTEDIFSTEDKSEKNDKHLEKTLEECIAEAEQQREEPEDVFETFKINTESEANSQIILRSDIAQEIADELSKDDMRSEDDVRNTEKKVRGYVPLTDRFLKDASEWMPEKRPMNQNAVNAAKVSAYESSGNSSKGAEQPKKLSAKEIKEKEIEKAVRAAEKLPKEKKPRKRSNFTTFNWARAVLAFVCATTAIFAAVYFVNLSSTDMSLKVAAMQSGIEAVYPSYIPRGYNLSDVTSASGKVTMNFKNDEGAMITLSEENTAWDSTALQTNYIKEYYNDSEYSVIKEQGLTIYMGENWEAWVNGGMLYKVKITGTQLTKKQLKTIATSM